MTLYYIHDPMCSWCWGFSKTYAQLVAGLDESIAVQRVLGGLAPDSSVPMPLAMQQQIKGAWERITEVIPGVTFNFDFWEKNIPQRSTYPACRAVIAARQQGSANDLAMTKAIQTAYYLQAKNPSLDETLIELAGELNLSVAQFTNDLNSAETKKMLNDELSLARELSVEGFPSLRLKVNDEIRPININYNNSQTMLDAINRAL